MTPAPRNRSMVLAKEDIKRLTRALAKVSKPTAPENIMGRVINQDLHQVAPLLPEGFVDLLFVDPPYNLTKSFNGRTFKKLSVEKYMEWIETWLPALKRTLKPQASIYICGDWRSSAAIQLAGAKYFRVKNRITFEREKGRGARSDWKNAGEDIWFMTNSARYHFDADAVKIKKKVIAPYRENGKPKDWAEEDREKFRLTHASNIWTDISIPFWSMPENTPHPTQKPEKLLAKIILASSRPGDVVLDPFGGVGTTAVVAKKLGRRFVTIERETEYCLFALRRLELADDDTEIQGYRDGVFWERNAKIKNGPGRTRPK